MPIKLRDFRKLMTCKHGIEVLEFLGEGDKTWARSEDTPVESGKTTFSSTPEGWDWLKDTMIKSSGNIISGLLITSTRGCLTRKMAESSYKS